MIHEKSRRTNAKKGMAMLAAAALLFGFGMVGCGGDDDPDDGPGGNNGSNDGGEDVGSLPLPSFEGIWNGNDGSTLTISKDEYYWESSSNKGTMQMRGITGEFVITQDKSGDSWKNTTVSEDSRTGSATFSYPATLAITFPGKGQVVYTKQA